MDTIADRYTSRKLWIAVVFEIIFTILVCYGKLPTSVFESLSYLLLGGYFVSNVSQQFVTKGVVK